MPCRNWHELPRLVSGPWTAHKPNPSEKPEWGNTELPTPEGLMVPSESQPAGVGGSPESVRGAMRSAAR